MRHTGQRSMPIHFNPRSPRGERRYGIFRFMIYSRNFNPRSPRGERHQHDDIVTAQPRLFQSTLPARGATASNGCPDTNADDFNPRSPRGERRGLRCVASDCGCISIHAPREGSDGRASGRRRRKHHISIHAPREGSDRDQLDSAFSGPDISIHAPREGSDTLTLPSVV